MVAAADEAAAPRSSRRRRRTGRRLVEAGLGRKLASSFPVDAFMALELVPGALAGRAGRVTYPAAFGPG